MEWFAKCHITCISSPCSNLSSKVLNDRNRMHDMAHQARTGLPQYMVSAGAVHYSISCRKEPIAV